MSQSKVPYLDIIRVEQSNQYLSTMLGDGGEQGGNEVHQTKSEIRGEIVYVQPQLLPREIILSAIFLKIGADTLPP